MRINIAEDEIEMFMEGVSMLKRLHDEDKTANSNITFKSGEKVIFKYNRKAGIDLIVKKDKFTRKIEEAEKVSKIIKALTINKCRCNEK